MKYNVDDKVVVVDDDFVYTTYYNWVLHNNLSLASDDKLRVLWSRYLDAVHDTCKKGDELTVIAAGHHGNRTNTIIYFCEDNDGHPVLIEEDGLAPAKEGLKWTDLKIGDVIKHKIHGYQFQVNGIDSNPKCNNHVFAFADWINDDDLADYWEKVEACLLVLRGES